MEKVLCDIMLCMCIYNYLGVSLYCIVSLLVSCPATPIREGTSGNAFLGPSAPKWGWPIRVERNDVMTLFDGRRGIDTYSLWQELEFSLHHGKTAVSSTGTELALFFQRLRLEKNRAKA